MNFEEYNKETGKLVYKMHTAIFETDWDSLRIDGIISQMKTLEDEFVNGDSVRDSETLEKVKHLSNDVFVLVRYLGNVHFPQEGDHDE